MSAFDAERLTRLRDVMAGHVERDSVGGVAWLAARDDDVEVGLRREPDPRRPISRFGATASSASPR